MRLQRGDAVAGWRDLDVDTRNTILGAFVSEGADLGSNGGLSGSWEYMGWLQSGNLHGFNENSYNWSRATRFLTAQQVLDSYGEGGITGELRVNPVLKMSPRRAYSLISDVLMARDGSMLTASEHIWRSLPSRLRVALRGTPGDFQHEDDYEILIRKFFQHCVRGGDTQ